MDNPKYLAVIVTPPVFKASGGVTAGLKLSHAISRIAPYEVALMSEQTSIEQISNNLTIRRFACTNSLRSIAKYAPRSLRTLATQSPTLLEYITKSKPDLVHIHNPHPAPALWSIAQTCLKHKIPYVMSAHGFIEYANPDSWLGYSKLKQISFRYLVSKPFKQAVDNAHAIFLTSPPENTVADALNIHTEKRFIVTNGYDTFFQEPASEAELTNVQNKFKLNSRTTPIFFFLGNHTANKGIDTLLNACHKAKQSWSIVIGGMIRSKKEHSKLLQKYQVNTLGERVIFTDFLSKNELRALYQSVDGFVFPSKADTLPLVILDAMASGLPVIATKVGGISYQVDDTNGKLIDPDNADALANALDELSLSKELRQQLGLAGLQKVNNRFHWNNSAKSALSIYEKLLKNYK